MKFQEVKAQFETWVRELCRLVGGTISLAQANAKGIPRVFIDDQHGIEALVLWVSYPDTVPWQASITVEFAEKTGELGRIDVTLAEMEDPKRIYVANPAEITELKQAFVHFRRIVSTPELREQLLVCED
jgi:hypothetical protein